MINTSLQPSILHQLVNQIILTTPKAPQGPPNPPPQGSATPNPLLTPLKGLINTHLIFYSTLLFPISLQLSKWKELSTMVFNYG